MRVIAYEVDLDDTALQWLWLRIETEAGRVTGFLAQYETTIRDQRVPVIRYDTAHGFAHRDVLDRRGEVIAKQPLASDLSSQDALAYGVQDIRANWRRYRRRFLGDDQ
ncbi:MAG: hypothetical protein K0S78_4366 [Thermomicrobiales bacterium]|jgi:hypothetical protein|nr:hypothetical protein [Thermomicrobiales bacterium]